MIKAVRVASLPILFQLPSPLDARNVTHRCTIARTSMGKLVVLEPFVPVDAAAVRTQLPTLDGECASITVTFFAKRRTTSPSTVSPFVASVSRNVVNDRAPPPNVTHVTTQGSNMNIGIRDARDGCDDARDDDDEHVMVSSSSLRSHFGTSRLTLDGNQFSSYDADHGHGEHGRSPGDAQAAQALRVRSDAESPGTAPRAT
eukprot:2801323-Heterocapsa_arctica.AAC.1